MPELPEVEVVCRTLAEAVAGRRVVAVGVARRDVVRGNTPLLRGQRIERVIRHGKQLALVGDAGGCACVHLGMSGSLCVVAPPLAMITPSGVDRSERTRRAILTKGGHVHVVWTLDDTTEVRFRDPRRFGGVWGFVDEAELYETRWGKLGPDGLVITPKQLHAGLSRTQRALKAALLDQHLVAGLGNIYVDELLYAAKLHPRKVAAGVTAAESRRLVGAMRRLLGRAIDAGGSTLRDYVDASGQRGGFQALHRVYGRAGEPCRGCGRLLESMVIAGRTTTACAVCQS